MPISNKIPAKDWTFEIDDGTDTDTFIEIKGIETFTPEPSSNRTDTTNNDSDGDDEGYISRRGLSLTLEGDYMEDVSDGSRDPGQERVEEAGQLTGQESVVPFKMTSPGGNVYEFDVTVDNALPTGGSYEENTAWEASLTKSGPTNKSTTT